MPTSTTPAPTRILVRGVNWLGDAVMTTPALQRLRERLPEAQIKLLTPAKLGELWENHPALDGYITFEPGEMPWSLGRRLRSERFETALVFPNSPRSALEMWFARIPQRVGYARPWRSRFLSKAVPTRPGHFHTRKLSVSEIKRLNHSATARSAANTPQDAHQIHEYLHLAAAIGAKEQPVPPMLRVLDSELEPVASKLGLNGLTLPGSLLFGLNPGAEYGPAKRWPAERFAEVAAQIQQRTGCTWLLLGGRADILAAERIVSLLPPSAKVANVAGKTTLRELCVLLKLCRVLLTNDTGPMHVAAALGTPVIVPFGSTSPELTGPGLPGDPRHHLLRSGVPCSPCFLRSCPIDFRCMTSISTEQVVNAVMRTLESAS